MLYMSSAPMATDADLTARARIRDAAIACFADRGVSDTPVRAIAAQAGVSPALVIHHFGSKDRLRVACDQHVAAIIRQGKQEAVAAGASAWIRSPHCGRRATDRPTCATSLARWSTGPRTWRS
jgi:AcrR family transcriptional regulator